MTSAKTIKPSKAVIIKNFRQIFSFTLAASYALVTRSLPIASSSSSFSNSWRSISIAESAVLVFLAHSLTHSNWHSILSFAIALSSLKIPLFTLVHRYFTTSWLADFLPSLLTDALSYLGQLAIHALLLPRHPPATRKTRFGLSDPLMLILSLVLVTVAGGLADYASERLILRPRLSHDLIVAARKEELNDYFLISPRTSHPTGMTLNNSRPTMAVVQLSSLLAVTVPVWLVSSSIRGPAWIVFLMLAILAYLVRLPISGATAISLFSVVLARLVATAGLLGFMLAEARREGDQADPGTEKSVAGKSIES